MAVCNLRRLPRIPRRWTNHWSRHSADCTAIDGSCTAFCGALDAVEDDAGCADQQPDYEECLNGEAEVCGTSCGGEENALVNCMIPYCQANPGDGDCQTLAAALS